MVVGKRKKLPECLKILIHLYIYIPAHLYFCSYIYCTVLKREKLASFLYTWLAKDVNNDGEKMYEREIIVAFTGNFYESDVSFRDQRKKLTYAQIRLL